MMNDQVVLFVSLVVLFSACQIDSRCCHFELLDNCDVFQKGGKSVCNRSIVSESDVANISELTSVGTDVISESDVVKLQDVEFSMWFRDMCVLCVSEGCPEAHDNCFEYSYHGDYFLFLNLSFSLGWHNVTKVIFEITELSKDGDVGQKTYHIIDVENPSETATSFDERDYYYTPINFLWRPDTHAVPAMLPDVSYMISVYLTDQNHVMVNSINVTVPDCFKLIEGPKDNYFCDKLKSIAYWLSEVYVHESEDGVIATFKVDTESGRFPNYTVALHNSVNNSVLQFVTLDNDEDIKDNMQFNEERNYWEMNHVFDSIPAGTFFVTVQANVNSSICTDEDYWGHKPCRIANSRNFTIVRSPDKIPTLATVDDSTDSPSPTPTTTPTPHHPDSTKMPTPTLHHPDSTNSNSVEKLPRIVIVVVVLFVIIVCLLFTIMVIKYFRKIWECLRGEDAADFQTVHPADSICGVVHKPLKTQRNHNGQIQRYLDDLQWMMETETDTSAGEPSPSEAFSLDETTVTDGCEHGDYRQRPFLTELPLLFQHDAESKNVKQANEYDPLTQEVSDLDQNSNEIRNGVIAHGQEPADGS